VVFTIAKLDQSTFNRRGSSLVMENARADWLIYSYLIGLGGAQMTLSFPGPAFCAIFEISIFK
jgi:hypothetical protein